MRPTFTSFAPNIELDDIVRIFKILLPWNWPKIKKSPTQLSETISKHFNKNTFLFDSGRTALKELLKGYNFPKGSKIIIQAFTCSVVPHAIIQAGYKPIYIDINTDYNIDTFNLAAYLEANKSNVKAIIVQNTFGIPAPIQQIIKIAKTHNIVVIEDLAHSLGSELQTKNGFKKLGTFSDSAILSFGSDKTISCTRGGAVVTNNKQLTAYLSKLNLTRPPLISLTKQVLQPLFFFMLKPFYNLAGIGIGKFLLYSLKKFRVLPQTVTLGEKQLTEQVTSYNLAPCLSYLLLNQWQKLDKFVKHRRKISKIYYSKLRTKFGFAPILPGWTLLRFPIEVRKRQTVMKILKKQNLHFDVWYDQVVGPNGTNMQKTGYKSGSCPMAELLARDVINLPTHIGITAKKAHKIANFILNNSNIDY